MGLRISFELDDRDLEHFRLVMREARRAVARTAPEDIVAAGEALLDKVSVNDTPGFIIERLTRIRLMIDMLTDIDWRLPQAEATRVLNALAYFVEPEDLIPDGIPGLGYLDDAIMIELVLRELAHEIEAYRDYRAYRNRAASEMPGRVSRERWLDERRQQLHKRMRRRRDARGRRQATRLLDDG